MAKEMKARKEDTNTRLMWVKGLSTSLQNKEEDRARAAEEMITRLREDSAA